MPFCSNPPRPPLQQLRILTPSQSRTNQSSGIRFTQLSPLRWMFVETLTSFNHHSGHPLCISPFITYVSLICPRCPSTLALQHPRSSAPGRQVRGTSNLRRVQRMLSWLRSRHLRHRPQHPRSLHLSLHRPAATTTTKCE